MPVVPLRPADYSGVPSVEPTSASQPMLHVNAPVEAFGGAMAEGMKALGRGTSDLGNELFGRAMAMQDLTNETNAKNANIDFMSEAGELHAKYNTLQGEERVAAFPGYMANLKAVYQKHRDGLGNPMAARMFDGAAVSTLNRSVFNAAGAAATAQQEASTVAANSEFTLTTKQVYNNPQDDASFRDAIDKSDQAAYTKAALSRGGATPQNVALIKAQGRSELAFNRIIGMAKDHPDRGYELLEQYEKEGLIFGSQDVTARNKVESSIASTGMNIIARNTLLKYQQPDGTFTKSATEMQQEVVKQAEDKYPSITGIGTSAQQAFDHAFGQHGYVQMQDERQRKQEVSDQIVKGVDKVDNLPPDLYKRLTPTEIKQFPANANSYRRAEQVQTNDQQYRDLLGLYNNDNAKFMDTNIYQVPGISKENMNFFLHLQRSAQSNGDPRVSRAMNWLKGYNPTMLDDLGVTGPAKDRDASNQFVGALHEAIQSYQETNGVAPSEKIITKEILPVITRDVVSKGWLWDSKTPFFKSDVPDEYKDQYLKLSPLANDTEIRHAYNRQMFDKFFKEKPSSGKTQGKFGE